MQHFFFNLRSDGVLVKDYVGETLGDLDEAIAQAVDMAQHLGDAEKSGANVEGRQIEICSETGLTVQVIAVKPLG